MDHYESSTEQGDAAMEMLGLLLITFVVLMIVLAGILVAIFVDMPSVGVVDWLSR